MTMFVKRLRPEASLPVRGSEQAAGFDLLAADATVVPAGGKAIVKTGLSVAVPEQTYARIAPRSGLAVKRMIDVGAGVVDADYRGEVGAVLFNHSAEDFAVAAGDRVAQLVVEKVVMCPCQEVESLEETARGAGGFGSTGVEEATVSTEPEAKKRLVEKSAEAVLRVQRIHAEASLPVRGSAEAAGFDLSASEAAEVPAGGKAIIKTGLKMAVPEGTYARIAPRSGLAAKRMIHCGAGVVDYDYRGEVGVVLFNYGREAFAVAPGDRVAQLILEQVDMSNCVEVDTLDDTTRGSGGFGSTGLSEKADMVSPLAEDRKDGPTVLLVNRISEKASLPVRGSQHAAGFDLAAAEATVVPAKDKKIVKTGLKMATPSGTYARVAPRSGLAVKRMLHCGAGVVDADYRGEVGVVLFNHGNEDFEVKHGDRVAQLILEKIAVLECKEVDSLESTARGAGGFGSTGVSGEVNTAVPCPVAVPCHKVCDAGAPEPASLQKAGC